MYISDRDLGKFVVVAVLAVAILGWATIEMVSWVVGKLSIAWG